MTIAIANNYQNGIDTMDGAVLYADLTTIVNELNAHTSAAGVHTKYLLKAGDTMSGALAVTIASNTTALTINTEVEDTSAALIYDSTGTLTTGRLLYLYSDSADVNGRNLLQIVNDNAAAVLTSCLMLQQDATMTAGAGVLEIYNGASLNFYIPETGIAYAKGLII